VINSNDDKKKKYKSSLNITIFKTGWEVYEKK